MTEPIPPDLPMRPLMEELVSLLVAVLDSHKDRDVAANLQLLVAEITGIRTIMDRHATAMEALIPRAEALGQLEARQASMEATLDKIAADVTWTRDALGGDVDGPM
ncbi:MAG: hypothetical protein AAF264_01605 [Pseudomonadota bacterium]